MTALTADKVVVELQAKVDAYNRNVEASRKRFEDNMDRIGRSGVGAQAVLTRAVNGMGASLGVLARAAGPVGLALTATIGVVASMSREIAALGENARKAQVDVQRFQELRLAGQSVGIDGKTFDAGMSGLAKELNEAKREETDLTRLLKANNIEIKDRRGQIISTNEALRVAAELIGRAREEQDRIEIAKRFGLPEEFVRLLERGAGGLEKIATEARNAGTVLDEETIKRAAEFDRAWQNGWSNFAMNAKAAIYTAAKGLLDLINQAANIKVSVGKGELPPELQKANDDYDAKRGDQRRNSRNSINAQLRAEPPEVKRARSEAGRGAMSAHSDQDVAGSTEAASRQVLAPLPRSRPGDLDPKIPTGGKGGGGGRSGGGGKSEAETAKDSLDKYLESLVRHRDVMEAEIATTGKSNAVKQAAIEIAKAQVNLEKLGTEEKQKYIDKLKEEVAKNEEVRASRDKLKAAQDGLRDAQRYFGDAAVDALEDLIINGEKAEDVIKNLTKSLAKAALQALLMGNGPLAGLFGTAGANGATGGIFGLLGNLIPGKERGGPVRAGQPYIVGEKRPELFVPNQSGRIIPRVPDVSGWAGRNSGGTAISLSPTYQIDARGSQMSEAQFRAILAQNNAALKAEMPGYLGKLQQRGGT